jgi:hypothetical protein
MKNLKYETTLAELQADLVHLNTAPPFDRFRDALVMTRQQLSEIRATVLKDGFADQAEEIHFFKHIKPQFIALQIYEANRYHLSLQCPAGTPVMVKAFYEEELLQVFRFFRLHAFSYQYYRCNANELDHLYFVRGAEPQIFPLLAEIDPYPGFSTAMDYPFAKFIAYEQLQVYLLEQLTGLYGAEKQQESETKQTPTLRWTGESINLVEIAYGLWLTGQLNEGNATITDIIHGLEEMFRVKIGVAYRRWTEISGRTHSTTKFLDRMRDAVQQRVDDDLDIRSRKRKARRVGSR